MDLNMVESAWMCVRGSGLGLLCCHGGDLLRGGKEMRMRAWGVVCSGGGKVSGGARGRW